MSGEEIVGTYMGLLLIILLLVVVLVVYSLTRPSRSRIYRWELTNLYVAAKVKQFAKKDNIDLTDEYEAFKKWCKKRLMEDKSLDDTIEQELKDKIAESTKSQPGVK